MKRKSFSKVLLGVTVVSLTAALCGCGGSSSGTSSAAGNSSSGETTAETTAESTGSAASHDEFVFGLDSAIASVDPHVESDAATRSVLFNVFEGLVKPATDGTVTPAVAESYEMSDDALTYTFKLRDGITFQDGNAVKASDVKYSLERYIEKNGDSSQLASISDISCPDDGTVVITLSASDTEFIYNLTVGILEEANDANQGTTPIGTGPFKVTEYKEGESISFERYDGYWNKDLDCIETATIKFYDKADTAYTELKAGSIDAMWQLTGDQVKELGDDYNVETSTMQLVAGLFLNDSVEPLNNVKVRQALNYAVDRETYDQTLMGGGSKILNTFGYPNVTEWYNSDTENTYTYDVDKAKQLLSEAGYPDGFDLEITVPSNYTLHVQGAQIFQQYFSEIGVNVTINPVDWNTWMTDVYTNHDYQATVIGFDISSLAPSTWYQHYYSSSKGNMCQYSSSEYDTLYEQAKAETDQDKKVADYKQLQQILTDDAASVFMMDPVNYTVLRKGFKGFASYPMYVIDLSSIQYE